MNDVGLRISCEKNDPGFAAFQEFGGWGVDWKVLLDGELVTGPITIDFVSRSVRRYLLNERGQKYLLADQKTIATEIAYGKIRVEVRERPTGDLIRYWE